MCPLELTATPATSPRCMSSGSFSRLGTESYAMVGTASCASAIGAHKSDTSEISAASHSLIGHLPNFFMSSRHRARRSIGNREMAVAGSVGLGRADGRKKLVDFLLELAALFGEEMRRSEHPLRRGAALGRRPVDVLDVGHDMAGAARRALHALGDLRRGCALLLDRR